MSSPPLPLPRQVTRVVLVDDHPTVRRGLRQLLEREADFEVCGEAADENEAFDLVEGLVPDLLITDLALEGRGGIELVKRVRRYHPELAVLVLSMHDERLYARRALSAGALGYVMKRCTDDEILRAAREVRSGRVFIGPGCQLEEMPAELPEPAATPLDLLTDREFEVFLLIGQGYAPRHIAEKLALSVSTVEVYRERLKEKLGMESSPLLLRYAVRWCKDQSTF